MVYRLVLFMTTIAKDVAAKFAVAAVAVAMVFSLFAPAASAQDSVEDLQALINSLMAQIADLEGDMGGSSMSSSSMVCPYTWTRDLSQGSEGADVMKLQQFLNENPDTRVAVSGAGSAGSETMYYGPATAAAVSKMQVMYRADVLTPAGLVNPTGYFGPSTRAKANSLCVAAPAAPDMGDEMDDDMMDDDMMDDDMDDDGPVSLSGEASLDSVDLSSEESDVEENQTDVAVAELAVEFENGDAEITRLDVELTADGSNDEDEPWDVFETVSLWIDGDMIAEMNADDEDDYLDENDGSLRFSGLGIIAEEDDEVEIIVAVSTQNNLDGLSDGETWNVTVESMRYFDADGVAETVDDGDSDADELGDLIDFDLEEEGADEELNISLASDSPDSTDIIVDTDSDTNNVTILIAELEAEDNDIEIDTIAVRVDTTGASTTDVIDEIRIELDGQSFEAESIGTTKGSFSASESRYVDNDSSDDAVWFVFDIDGDVVVEEDEEMDMDVVVDFNDTDDGARYANGTQIRAVITSTETAGWDAEGADEVTVDGTASGDSHTLVAEGIVVPVDGVATNESTSGDNDQTGSFSIDFDVTAVEADFYVFDVATEGAFNATTTGVTFEVDGPSGFSATSSGVITSTADEDTDGIFTVREGQTETFTLTVTVDTDTSGNHRVNLTGVGYSDDTTVGDSDDVAYQPVPEQDFRTDYINVNAN